MLEKAFSLVLLVCLPALATAQRITTPKEFLGHNFGDDYWLANYQQITGYWKKLDTESDRMVLKEIGKTAEGRPHLMAIVTSPENHQRLERYRQISHSLALAEGLTEQQARALAKEGKAVVWIDGGLHATEVLGAQQLAEMIYQMVSGTDDETMRILNDVIILFVHANPDGNDLVADWYMRRQDPRTRSTGNIPRLYQKYIGHDNNRDFFASTQAETENMNRVLYHEWSPQILYNHHQSGPAGTVVWTPPLRDPYNYNLHPGIVLGFHSLGAAMHTRLALENKPGATSKTGGPYDGWWNGGIRNTAAFHNTIALLTEMIGNPTPQRIPFVAARQVPYSDLILPIAPQEWHFRQSVEYSLSLNRAVLDYASRMRENLLYNIYVMGKSSIDRGSSDHWTPNPKRIAAAGRDTSLVRTLKNPEWRDPRAFIIPSNQRDFATATKFINALREVNVTVHRATQAFTVNGKNYPAGSFVVFTAQAFRPHVLDMFEPQVHPDVFPVPGGPPTPPYDHAGWTFAYQMGVEFDRILDGFTGPFERVTDWNLAMPAGKVTGSGNAFVMSGAQNNAFIAANRLLKQGARVSRLPNGDFVTRADVGNLARELGVNVERAPQLSQRPQLPKLSIALWDQYGGSMDAGWARWILEQFEFPFERVFAQRLDAGDLNKNFDVIVFVSGAIPEVGGQLRPLPEIPDLPEEYRTHVGRVTAERTIPQLRQFVENGGTIVAIGESAANLAAHFQLPIGNHLVENGRPLERTKFYLPGSVLRAKVDTTHWAAVGLTGYTDFFFDDSPLFRIESGASNVKPIAWFDSATPLRSGWAWGERYLENGVLAAEVRIGRGRVLLYAPEILKRAQPHGTFKLLFNAFYPTN